MRLTLPARAVILPLARMPSRIADRGIPNEGARSCA